MSKTSKSTGGKTRYKKGRSTSPSGVVYEVSELPNGIRIATAEMPHMASASLGLWATVGSRHELAAEHGAAHFIEHLLFKGTPARSASEIAREIEGIGGNLDAYTSEDHTCYYTKGPAEMFDPMVDVLADMYRNPTLRTADIDNERSVIKEEIAMVRDQPSQYLDDILSAAAWGDSHPLGRSIAGTIESLDRLDRASLGSFFKRAYIGRQTVVTAAGNITHQQALAEIAPRLGAIRAGQPLPVQSPHSPPGGGGFGLATMETEQVHFSIAFHAFNRHEDERYIQKLLCVLLGENMSSLLFQKLREEEAVCYSIQSDIMMFDDAGLLHIYCALDPEHLSRALQIIAQTLDELRRNAPSEGKLEEAKGYVVGQSRIALENTGAQMTWLGESIMSYGRLVDPLDSQTRIKAVSSKDIQRVANTLFEPGRLVVAAVGPEGVEAPLRQWQRDFCKQNK
jgi:predicted Zn-dependent peptidase